MSIFCRYLLVVPLSIVAISCSSRNHETRELDNQILQSVLENYSSNLVKHSVKDERATIVKPMTVGIRNISTKDMESTKRFICARIKDATGYNVTNLLNRLIERNRESTRLSLSSSPADGYLIDYDGKYAGSFDESGYGWRDWYKDNPGMNGITLVSLPAYDDKHELILVYVENHRGELAAVGDVVAYTYKNGILTEVARVMLWIS